MSDFLKAFKDFALKNNYNIIRVTEICNDEASELSFYDTFRCLNSYSVSKVFTVSAIGMMCDDKLLSTDDKIVDILGRYTDSFNSDFASLTVDDALKHRMGLEGGYLDIDLFPAHTFGNNFLSNVLNAPTVCAPGGREIYTDAAFYLLARVVEEKCGIPLENLLWQRLFEPLGFSEAAWSKCPQGHAMGATGLYISTCDMAKLGQLYLNGGQYNGRQIISSEWVNTVLSRGYELKPRNNGAYGKGGMYGQMLLIVPKEHRVIAWHAFEHKNISPLIDWVISYK